MMSAKAAAIQAPLGIFKGIFVVFLLQTVQAIERQPKVELMLVVRLVWKL